VFALVAVPAVISLAAVLLGLTFLVIGEPVRPRHVAKARDASVAT
jgi:hypothetical protein